MAKNLVIVESPAKGKTIEKYLGKDYKVLASFGHVRDLPSSTLGVDVKKNFSPQYVIPSKAKKVLAALKKEVESVDTVYLATDYDREGEAIAWHLVAALKTKKPYKRITFHEITKPAITEAVTHPREIDMDLVDAQQARRVLDRLVGYKLSPFLWKKVAQGLSAGRVQSVTLRLIVEREREIQKFKPDEYWSVEAWLYPKNDKKNLFKVVLWEKDQKRLEKLAIANEKAASEIVKALEGAKYQVASVEKNERKRTPAAPFITSTMQQDAVRKLNFSAKQTMKVAQDLYEDGHITYMRTDSVNVSKITLDQTNEVVRDKYGPKYALETPRVFTAKVKGAQEAHEAIHPTDMTKDAAALNLSGNHARLYDLIYKRMIASQMAEAKMLEVSADILANKMMFRATGSEIAFDGFLKVYQEGKDEEEKQEGRILPDLEVGEVLSLDKLEKLQHFTEAPARYSEGSLIKELEKRGIGRPSTYAPTLSTIQDRNYVEKVAGRFMPQEVGFMVNDILVEHFPDIVDYDFTAEMEENLDKVAEGKLAWQPMIKNFYAPFEKILENKMESVPKEVPQEKTDEKCPECAKPLMIKFGRFGKFMACSGFPDCKFTKPYLEKSMDEKTEQKVEKEASKEKCEKCGGQMMIKESRFGPFLGCENYPKCKFTKSIEIAAPVPCPNCGKKLVRKVTKRGKPFWGCSGYPKCKTAFWQEPVEKKCPDCGSLLTKDPGGKMLKCSSKDCDFRQENN